MEIEMSHITESGKSSYELHDGVGNKYVISDESNGDVPYHSGDEPYPEMTKEHLLRHSSKPLWRILRTISIAIIIVSWLALIAATIAIIVIHPRCKNSPDQKWWQKSTIYRVYIRSFQDSDGNGIGDLNGVSSRLVHLQSMGYDTISLSAFYEHDEAVNEFSVTNHTAVGDIYGTMEDFDKLVTAVHEKDMRLILDFIPGTTSADHPWFVQSSQNNDKINMYRNYYTWNAGVPIPNWLTIYSRESSGRQPAWTEAQGSLRRNESYLHQLLSSQPSLNLRNYEVQDELKSILQFWLERGADGFYIRNSAYLFVDPDLRDEEPNPDSSSNRTDDYDYYKHERTFGLPEINDMFSRWRYLLAHHSNEDNEDRLLFADIAGSTEQKMLYYGRYGRDGVDFPLGDNLMMIKNGCNGACVKKHLDELITNIPEGKSPAWRLGSEDITRLEDRTNGTLSRALTLLAMLLPGTVVSYYGDEIGMTDSPIAPTNLWSMEQPMRSPMQWDNFTHAGFVSNCANPCYPWLPVNGDYSEINAEVQTSEIGFYTKLITLRQNPSIQFGNFRYIITNENIVSFQREFDGQTNILVAINFGTTEVKQDFTPNEDVTEAMVEIATHPGDKFKEGDSISLDGVILRPGEGVVLSFIHDINHR